MSDFTVTLSADERQHLLDLLEEALKAARIEEHRTRAPNYREFVMRKEEHLQSILDKLRRQPAAV